MYEITMGTFRTRMAPWHDFYFNCFMKEEIYIKGKKVWVLIEPHVIPETKDDQPKEYFTASYDTIDPPSVPGGILFVEPDNTPRRFDSPVQTLEFANEKLLGLI